MMTDTSKKSAQRPRSPDLIGAEIAMHRAAERARRMAQEAIDPEPDKPFGPDGMLGGLTQQEIGSLRRRLDT